MSKESDFKATSKRLEEITQRCNLISQRVDKLSSEIVTLRINLSNNTNSICKKLGETNDRIQRIVNTLSKPKQPLGR